MAYQRLTEISNDLISNAATYTYTRMELFEALEPLFGHVTILKGARGIGKSTLLQQFLLKKQGAGHKVFYLSADSTLLTNQLAELAYDYHQRGGEYLAIDEIHKYNGWQAEIKTILDAFPKLHLLVSGSSSLHLDYATVDLSRRHILLHAKGLSFREYLNKNYAFNFNTITLADILDSTSEIALTFTKSLRDRHLDLLALFKHYLQQGYFLTRDNYPSDTLYYDSLLNSINSVIEADIPAVHEEIDSVSKNNLKKLLKHIATKCPFTPNIAQLSRNLSIPNDNSLKKYLHYLNEGEILTNLYAADKSHKDFQKPHKIFLNNPNFAYAYCQEPTQGTVRETFVATCLRDRGELTAPTFGDFCFNGDTIFEVGGSSKTKKQIKSVKNSFVLAAETLSSEQGRIPLWLLGFLW